MSGGDFLPAKVLPPEAQRWLMLLAYNGFGFHGWQRQKGQSSIESTLAEAIFRVSREEVKVYGAGRTDAQVHALNQTAHFTSTHSNFTAERWRSALNGVLPREVAVKCVLPVAPEFHARHSALGKRYRYLIYQRPYPPALGGHFCWWVRHHLDLTAMQLAAEALLGEHDFSAFRAAQCDSPSPVKHLRALTVTPVDWPHATLCIEAEANSFLQHMVRILVGTLVEVGMGLIPAATIPQVLASRKRQQSGQTAPPYGLYVLKVYYKEEEVQWPVEDHQG